MKRNAKCLPILFPTLLALLGGGLLSADSHAAPAANPAAAVAESGLATLKQMTTQETYASTGFQSLDEVGKAKLGAGVKVYMIGLDDLKALSPTADPKSVLRDFNEQLYVVHVGGTARAAIVVRLDSKDNQWKVVSMGDAAIVQLLDGARGLHSKASGSNHEYFLIRIPAIYQMFLGFTDGSGKMHFITMHDDDKDAGGKRGEARPARTVLDLLTKIAKSAKPIELPTK